MALLEIPLRTDGYPAYDVSVELDGRVYTLDLHWNDRDGAWFLSILDSDGEAIVSGIRVVVNVALTRKCADPRIMPGMLYALDTTGEGDPGRYDLGDRVPLIYEEA